MFHWSQNWLILYLMNNGFAKNLQQEYISIKINKIWINIDYAVLQRLIL